MLLPPAEILDKAIEVNQALIKTFDNKIVLLARHANRKVRRYYIKLFPVTLSDNRFFRQTANFNLNEPPPFFFRLGDKDIIVELLKNEYTASIEQKTLKDADEICTHIFDLLGSDKQELGKEICWHLDFKTGFRWNPRTYI